MRKFGFALLVIVASGCGDNGHAPLDTTPDAGPDAEVYVNCGDGFTDPPEQCDDGDEIADMICSATCRLTCGNGVVDTQFGETCDVSISTGAGACPTSCDDGMACTSDVLAASECTATCINDPISAFVGGDGCCPAGATSTTDSDCPAVCGDGVVGIGESCDTAINSGPGACPMVCNDNMACTQNVLSGTMCAAQCSFPAITTPINGDGCCPSGATMATDDDCLPTCGNGVLDGGELCDPLITTGAGVCPTTCNDSMSCTTDALVMGGTCQARCTNTPITLPMNSDGCCPPGANTGNDNDCVPGCGNGVVDPGETCDRAILVGPGSCPTTCSDGMMCTRDVLSNAGTCTAACSFPAITTPMNGDGCCPAGANRNTDNDCPAVCGNSVLEMGELCDTGIAAGAGSCPTVASCNDSMACTTDAIAGTLCQQRCTNVAITLPMNGDGCCPSGATMATDNDCAAPTPTAFRMSDLDLRDPHVFVNFLGCRDVTDTPLVGFSVNGELQTNIQTDGDTPADGLLDLSPTLIFRPLTQVAGASTPVELNFADCTAPIGSTICRAGTGTSVRTMSTNSATGATTPCLTPLAGTLRPYTPAVTSSSTPCFVTGNTTVMLNLGGVPITLTDARVAATYVGNPASNTVNGLLMGFVSEADANATVLPSTLPLVGGQRLSSLLPGGMGNCASHDTRDMNGAVRGWWFYLNFTAPRVTWIGP
ncbi:MAG: hypothetical protein IT370_02695 [Deltaproteobacteria bacterium]|nr:hypothetical protein [Deltaproteobacteria bacterium]